MMQQTLYLVWRVCSLTSIVLSQRYRATSHKQRLASDPGIVLRADAPRPFRVPPDQEREAVQIAAWISRGRSTHAFAIVGSARRKQRTASGARAHGGGQFGDGGHQEFSSGSCSGIGRPNSAATFFWTSMKNPLGRASHEHIKQKIVRLSRNDLESQSMNPLDISTSQFRRLADQIATLAAQYLDELDARRITPDIGGDEITRLFRSELPERGMGEEALRELQEVVGNSRAQNGRFFGYVLGSGEPVGATAEILTSVLNQNGTPGAPGQRAPRSKRLWLAGWPKRSAALASREASRGVDRQRTLWVWPWHEKRKRLRMKKDAARRIVLCTLPMKFICRFRRQSLFSESDEII